ncbi:glycosyltransferase family 92 protein [Yoonia sp. GPGPB17]|uniref:glycosyltransferase family 92 protein n=1 Tax=Yoonia sp. GPGPB17 TaxID=3026147 RepID=UPI0030BBBF82
MRLFRSKHQKLEAAKFYVQPQPSANPPDRIAIAVLVKDEAEPIAEWLRFHYAAGVDKFLLYDDGCSDATFSVAGEAVPTEAIEIIPWSQRIKEEKSGYALDNQGLAFAHAVSNYGEDFRWMAFIDVDEFLFPTRSHSLKDYLLSLGDIDNIVLPWQMFGRQGFAETPPLVLPNFLKRFRDPYQANVKGVLNFKCIVNPSRVTKAYVHGFETNHSSDIYNSLGQKFEFGEHRQANFHCAAALQLNHYYAKSDQQFKEKVEKGAINESTFTRHFKRLDGRSDTLLRRVQEIERDTVEDRLILEFCKRMAFDFNAV